MSGRIGERRPVGRKGHPYEKKPYSANKEPSKKRPMRCPHGRGGRRLEGDQRKRKRTLERKGPGPPEERWGCLLRPTSTRNPCRAENNNPTASSLPQTPTQNGKKRKIGSQNMRTVTCPEQGGARKFEQKKRERLKIKEVKKKEKKKKPSPGSLALAGFKPTEKQKGAPTQIQGGCRERTKTWGPLRELLFIADLQWRVRASAPPLHF